VFTDILRRDLCLLMTGTGGHRVFLICVTMAEQERDDGTGIPVMRNTVKSVMMKWWRWKHRDPVAVPNPFCV
jgi:hypothetical protein